MLTHMLSIQPQGRDATPYLERNRVGRDALDSASALTDLGKYLFQERRLPVYDIAVVVTKWVHQIIITATLTKKIWLDYYKNQLWLEMEWNLCENTHESVCFFNTKTTGHDIDNYDDDDNGDDDDDNG